MCLSALGASSIELRRHAETARKLMQLCSENAGVTVSHHRSTGCGFCGRSARIGARRGGIAKIHQPKLPLPYSTEASDCRLQARHLLAVTALPESSTASVRARQPPAAAAETHLT